jgi:nucleoside-diphosphate-sugar epimerase
MNIAVIGSNSLLASYIIDELWQQKVYQLHLFGKNQVNGPHTKFSYFSYPESRLELVDLLAYDVIVYCAAAGVQANKLMNADLIYEINAFLPIKILNYLSDNNFGGTWISFGSYFEIGNNNIEHNFTEIEIVASELTVPNHYCSSKRLLTRFVSNGISAVKMLHFILPTIYGVRENATRLIPYLVETLRTNQPIQLSAGTQVRQYIHCRDVASLVNTAIYLGCESGVYNVAKEAPIKIRDLITHVFSLFDRSADSSLGTLSTRDESMGFLAMNSQKLSSKLPSWKASVDLQEGINEYL